MDEKEKLIKKWLDHELSQEEYEAFKELDEYSSYAKISEKAHHFKAPDFDEEASREELEGRINSTKKRNKRIQYIYVAAAIITALVLSVSLFEILYQKDDSKSITTKVATSETIQFPDHSEVNMNSRSELSYHPDTWNEKRELFLAGEAYFKVQNGNAFHVKTDHGDVQVLGTIFNVKSRDYSFQVSCYEGSVKVNLKNDSFIVQAGEVLTMTHNDIKKGKTNSKLPDWKRNQTIINSKSLEIVLQEFKNYYDVEFDISQVDKTIKYTGTFGHDDLEKALQSITLPLDLSYRIDDKEIFLSKNK